MGWWYHFGINGRSGTTCVLILNVVTDTMCVVHT